MKLDEWDALSSSEKESLWPTLSDEMQRLLREAAAHKKQEEIARLAEIVPPVIPTEESTEYYVLSQSDKLFSGRFDAEYLTSVLNHFAAQGWRVVSATSSNINTLLGGNRDEILIFLERKLRK